MKNLYCIVGRSGSGKTTLAEELERQFGYTSICSYCTRPQRYEGETGHIFVTEKEFHELGELSAYNFYNGYEYGATPAQVNENDLYVIDIPGIRSLKKNYSGPKNIVVFGLVASPEVVRQRMAGRGDSEKKIQQRLNSDVEAFKDLEEISDYIFDVDEISPEELATIVQKQILECER